MTWWGWVLLSVYLIGWVIAVPRFGYVLAGADPGCKLDGADVFGGLFFGGLTAFAWPIAFPVYKWFCYAKAHNIQGAGLLVPPRHIRQETEMKRREDEMWDREQRISRMERELGVGQR